MIKYGKLIFINIVCRISDSTDSLTFKSLPYKPVFNTESYSSSNGKDVRTVFFTNGNIYVYNTVLKNAPLYISGVYFIE